MATDLDHASVVALWRYPVKSMQGEELNATGVTARGVVGDRQFALRDRETGKIVGAKNPRKWPNFFDFRAGYVEPPQSGGRSALVRITLPDGSTTTTDRSDVDAVLSAALEREVSVEEVPAAPEPGRATAEAFWPDLEGLEHRNTVTHWDLPTGAFFDVATVHLLTTATLDRLRFLYPDGRFEARRFRPNFVVAPASEDRGFVENDWVGRTVAVGDEVRLRVTGPCARCVMTTLAQGDLPRDLGILRAAAQGNEAKVGVYADVVRGGKVRRGDRVTIES